MSNPYKATAQLFSPDQIQSLRRGGKILHDCLRHVAPLAKPGVKTIELDRVAEQFIRDHGAEPGFKGYRGFTGTLCTSINDACVHGIPGDDELTDGDIVSLDCGVLLDSLYTDSCITVPVGQITPEAETLLRATEEALHEGIKKVRADVQIGDISAAIQKRLRKDGFDAIKQLTGHGLGDTLHQFPEVPNFGKKGTGPRLPVSTIIALEPISTMGSTDIREDDDHWTLRTKDGALSAHFEHTVLVTDGGCEILT